MIGYIDEHVLTCLMFFLIVVGSNACLGIDFVLYFSILLIFDIYVVILGFLVYILKACQVLFDCHFVTTLTVFLNVYLCPCFMRAYAFFMYEHTCSCLEIQIQGSCCFICFALFQSFFQVLLSLVFTCLALKSVE